MECTRCGKIVQKVTKMGFCSRSCANARQHSEETKLKMSRSASVVGPEARKRRAESAKAKWADPVFRETNLTARKQLVKSRSFDTFSLCHKKKLVREEQEGKCARCRLDSWQGEPLVIEIDHIDGDTNNNTRSNLIGLCPNCHSLTPSWRRSKHYLRSITDRTETS